MKRTPVLFRLFLLSSLFLLLLQPLASFEGAKAGLLLWFNSVLPSLLPFLILSDLCVHLNAADTVCRILFPLIRSILPVSRNGIYVLLIGLIAGLPLGAKTAGTLVKKGEISLTEGQFLLEACNNFGPMFLCSFVAAVQLNRSSLGILLFLVLNCSSLISALLCRTLWHKERVLDQSHRVCTGFTSSFNDSSRKLTITEVSIAFNDAVTEGLSTITRIGGYIILFSAASRLLTSFAPSSLPLLLFSGLFEVTNGISIICMLPFSLNEKTVLCAILASFGGLSGLAQTKSVLVGTKLSVSHYFLTRLSSSLITALLLSGYWIIQNLF